MERRLVGIVVMGYCLGAVATVSGSGICQVIKMGFLQELNSANVPKKAYFKSLYDFPLGVPYKVLELKWGSTRKGECVRLDVKDHLECLWCTFYEGKKSLYPEEKCYDDDVPVFDTIYEIEPKETRSE